MSPPSDSSTREGSADRPERWSRRRLGLAALGLGAGAAAIAIARTLRFASDRTPEGAYERIAYAIGRGEPRDVFAYLEDPAQHACFTIRDYRGRSSELVRQHYPDEERARLLAEYEPFARTDDGADVWVRLAEERGYVRRLRRDLSGIARVEIEGERATVETARGTRYPFRRRAVGIWGLTLFTAEMVAEAERAARDHAVIERAAADYASAR